MGGGAEDSLPNIGSLSLTRQQCLRPANQMCVAESRLTELYCRLSRSVRHQKCTAVVAAAAAAAASVGSGESSHATTTPHQQHPNSGNSTQQLCRHFSRPTHLSTGDCSLYRLLLAWWQSWNHHHQPINWYSPTCPKQATLQPSSQGRKCHLFGYTLQRKGCFIC